MAEIQTITITDDNNKKRFDVFLVEYFESKYPRAKIASLIDEGIFLINQKKQKTSYKLKLNDIISFDETVLNKFLNPSCELKPWNFDLDVIYEDDFLAVINKEKNILTHPTKYDREHTLVNALLYRYQNNLSNIQGIDRLGIVHRLDKNTSGLIVIAKDNDTHIDLANQIKEKSAKRKYLALALGNFEQKEGTIDKPLVHYLKNNVKMNISDDDKGLKAITHYKVIEEFKGVSLVELELKTGRTHQIRAHLASINHPIFGDSLYGAKSFMRNEFYNLKTQEQLLQSYYLSFTHPKTKEFMEFQLKENKFSKDFIKVLNFLRSKNEH